MKLPFRPPIVMNPQAAYPVVPAGTVIDLVLGSIFVFVGTVACGIAALRRGGASRALVWFGLFIAIFGMRMLAEASALLGLVPGSPWPQRLVVTGDYLLVIPALLFWTEVSVGILQRAFQWLTVLSSSVAALGLGWFAIFGVPNTFLRFNSLLAICLMVLIGILVLVPRVARKCLTIQSPALRIATPVVALIGLYVNVKWYFGVPPAHFIEPATFALWVSAIGYEAAKRTFDNERRLFSIDSELETARQIQSSILPDSIPSVAGLRIAATYKPMSAVAGDFYQFLEADAHCMGILVADVSGHGVPAALIASMIKIAMQSAASSAGNPSQVLGHLNRILTPELKGRLTSAAYLWLDTRAGYARYSAAGHPPLLHWKAREGRLHPVDCNGLLFGVTNGGAYPECELRLDYGDRLLLYTDGLIEPENAQGESFGDRELGRVVKASQALAAPELAERMLGALGKWQPGSAAQQDDITLLVLDIVNPGVEGASCPEIAAAGIRTGRSR